MLFAASPHPVRDRKSERNPCLDKKHRQAPTGPNATLGALNVGGYRRKEGRGWKSTEKQTGKFTGVNGFHLEEGKENGGLRLQNKLVIHDTYR